MPSKVRYRGNNTYEIATYIGYDENGKQIVKRKTIKVKNLKEAQKAQTAFENDLRRGDVTLTGKLKLGEFAKQWFKEHCEKKLAPKTQQSYRNHLNNRILPALGHIDINNLRPQHIIDFVNDISEARERFDGRNGKISSESLYYSFRVLSSMLQDAVQWQIIPNNPCKRVEAPKVNRRKIKILDEDNIAKMIGLLANEPLKYRTILMLAIDSGLRLGEIMGLKWADINFNEATISVNKANQAIAGIGVFTKQPKTESSVRKVALSETTLNLLATYKSEQDEIKISLENQWINEDWVFTQWNGTPMYPTTPSHWFRDFLKRHGLPPMRFHALRHLSATVLISKGVPLKNVSSRLGHADIRTTTNIYSEALSSVDREAAVKMDEFLKRNNINDNE